ncbi:MAG: type II toxin-antitoxin system RelE/ParE family toxin [Candidatus Bathyarchaeia archaeon]
MPKYKIVAHRKVHKFLNDLTDQALKKTVKDHIAKLQDYPLSLREMDTEKIHGVEKTFRLRIGKYRIIFFVNKSDNTIYVTDIKARKKAYTK